MPVDAKPAAVRSTCPYCGVGCGLIIETEGAGSSKRIVAVRGDPAHPANHGRLCTKGSSLHLTADPLRQRQARLMRPMRREARGHAARPISWGDALDDATRRFADCIARHGPDSVAFYVSGQLLTEDYYAFNKLAKGLVGTNNIDSNSRLCMSSAVAGYKATLGADAPPACYEDIEATDCVFITGSNTAFAHPVLFARLEAARARRPHMRLVVVDPRRTDTAAAADLHLAIRPGTDSLLLLAMLHVAIAEDRIDHDLVATATTGFGALRERARGFTPERAAVACGVDAASIVQAARWFASSPATLSLYCQGLNQSASGTVNNVALVGLHLATGQIGRPGAGPLSLTGQPNAMGGREVGALANLASGHRNLADADDRDEIARYWGVRDVPDRPGLAAVDLFDAVGAGRVRMVWIACTNPVHSMPDAARVAAALGRAEYVVVQDAFAGTATAEYADLLLPATTWGEKSGTVTNSERRISRVRAALDPLGEARADWEIAADFARRLEAALAERGIERRCDPAAGSLFAWPDAEAIWNEHRGLTRGRDLDITGLSYRLLDQLGPQQWPMPVGASAGTARLYVDRRFASADGRAHFGAIDRGLPAEPTDAEYPVGLLTGRLRDQWHGMSRTGLLGRLFGHEPEPVIELPDAYCVARGWRDGDLVRITSRRGSQVLPLRQTESLRPGTAFVAMHWGPEFLAGGTGVNALTLPAVDPVSKQPELKHCAVRIEPAPLSQRLVAFGWLEAGRVVAARRELLGLLRDLPFASSVPFGRDAEGVMLRGASDEPFDKARIAAIEAVFGVANAPLVTLDDARSGCRRHLLLANGRLRFVLLTGSDTASGPWLRELLVQEADAAAFGARLLASGAAPPLAIEHRGRTVCNCVGVTETPIRAALEAATGERGERIEAARRLTGCGTQCGACLAEVGRLADDCLRRLHGAAIETVA